MTENSKHSQTALAGFKGSDIWLLCASVSSQRVSSAAPLKQETCSDISLHNIWRFTSILDPVSNTKS